MPCERVFPQPLKAHASSVPKIRRNLFKRIVTQDARLDELSGSDRDAADFRLHGDQRVHQSAGM